MEPEHNRRKKNLSCAVRTFPVIIFRQGLIVPQNQAKLIPLQNRVSGPTQIVELRGRTPSERPVPSRTSPVPDQSPHGAVPAPRYRRSTPARHRADRRPAPGAIQQPVGSHWHGSIALVPPVPDTWQRTKTAIKLGLLTPLLRLLFLPFHCVKTLD